MANVCSQQVVSEIWPPEKYSHAPFFLPPSCVVDFFCIFRGLYLKIGWRYFAANCYTGWMTPNLLEFSCPPVVYKRLLFKLEVLQNPQLSWRRLLFANFKPLLWPHEWSDCFLYFIYVRKVVLWKASPRGSHVTLSLHSHTCFWCCSVGVRAARWLYEYASSSSVPAPRGACGSPWHPLSGPDPTWTPSGPLSPRTICNRVQPFNRYWVLTIFV